MSEVNQKDEQKLQDVAVGGHRCQVTLDRAAAVAVVRFSRPPNNHFNAELLRDIADALEQADKSDGAHAIVLASEGRHFCAGADLIANNNDPYKLYEQADRMFAVRKPIIAAVQGAAIGGGLGLALAADFRFVAPSSRLAANFVKLGTHPGFAVTYTLPRIVGYQTAAEILYTGRRLTGEEALRCGLADRLVPEDRLQESATAFAAEIAANAPLALEETRATLRAGLQEAIHKQTQIEAAKQVKLKATADFAEGVRAVAERRPGNWTRR